MALDPPKLLTSWKEIAAFFGKGVRTVQRWESIGMPVHRPKGDKSIVMADPDELRRWATLRDTQKQNRDLTQLNATLERSRALVRQTASLVAEMQRLINELNRPPLLPRRK